MTYVNPRSVIAVGVIFPLLGLCTVTSRFLLRHKRKTDLSWDDWLCIPALVLVWAEGAVMITGSAMHTFGYHSPMYDIDNPMNFLTDDQPSVRMLGMLQTVFDLMNPAALAFIKLSVLFFYRRLFRGRAFDIISWITCIVTIVWAVTFTTTIAAACGKNFNANWKSLLTLKEECVDTFRILLAYSITDTIVDLTLLIMPIPLIFNLHTTLQRKFAICGVLLIGMLAVACGITRLAIFSEIFGPGFLQKATVAGVAATDDFGVVSLLVFWGMVELGVGMIAICLPTLRPLIAGVSPESIIRSVRSAISLRSIHSGSGRSPRNTTKVLERTASDSSAAGINMDYVSYSNGPKMSRESTVQSTARYGESGTWIAFPKNGGNGGIRVDQEFVMNDQDLEAKRSI